MKYEMTLQTMLSAGEVYKDQAVDNVDLTALKAAIMHVVSQIPEPLPTLRPIAEIPKEIPTGCGVISGVFYDMGPTPHFETDPAGIFDPVDHFLMFRLPAKPDPLEDLRLEFEETFPNLRKKRTPSGDDYEEPATQYVWVGFRAGKEKGVQP